MNVRLKVNDLVKYNNRTFTVLAELDYEGISVPAIMLPITYRFKVEAFRKQATFDQNTGEDIIVPVQLEDLIASILPLSRDDLSKVDKGFFSDVQKKLYIHVGREFFVYYIGKEVIS